VKEAVAATVPANDDQVKVPQESMQNGATHTTVPNSSDEDANGTGQVLKEKSKHNFAAEPANICEVHWVAAAGFASC
jgi:hypothetical protein